jgi:DNA helicase HerA-like ATPase
LQGPITVAGGSPVKRDVEFALCQKLSFKNVRFEHNTREILLNIIGRFMLDLARKGTFRDKPMIVFLDEAHQFLGRKVGDEYGSVNLHAFGLIAKEGRNYGLSCTLATQRPRDIRADVLSQLGTLIVHRSTNDHDRDTVEKACGDLDRDAAMFIPTLAPGGHYHRAGYSRAGAASDHTTGKAAEFTGATVQSILGIEGRC